jgi:hypothetical protein
MIDTGQRIITRSDIIAAIGEQADQVKVTCDGNDAQLLKDMTDLLDEGDSATGCREGWHLILDSHFEQWCESYAGGMGPISGWPYNHIDWSKAADALKQDYKQVSFSDETYWVRA